MNLAELLKQRQNIEGAEAQPTVDAITELAVSSGAPTPNTSLVVHRVHHGRNERYLDRNYGETLIIWDYCFNSYQAEMEAPDYGVLAAVDSGDFGDIQTAPWRALYRDLRQAKSLRHKLRVALSPP